MMKMDQKMLRDSQKLRRDMMKEERHLWYDFLKTYPVQFKRQSPIGTYIVDFYCFKAKLVVELDGSQHCEPAEIEHDKRRTAFLEEKGLYVLRFSNLDVMRNFVGVCEDIDRAVRDRIDFTDL
jgi:very-short-patch-repair endonuclease